MDVQKKLDEIVAVVENARSMPMSASCVVNRAELLGMLDEVRKALPESLSQAETVLEDRERVVAEARREAERILASAHAERGSLISGTQVARQSQEEAERILAEARRDSEEIRAEADDYVDSKLANFEVVLTKTIAAVDRGREKLLGRGLGLDENGALDADLPERVADPEELRHRADEYVDAKLASFEAVLDKTLEAVGRGRQKLLGRRPIDELGEYAAEGDAGPHAAQSDADYVAALAGQPAQPITPQPARPQDAAGGYEGYGYGYAESGWDSSGQPQTADAGYAQDGYAGQQGGWQSDPGYGTDQGGYVGYGGENPGYGQGDPYSTESGWSADAGYAPQPPSEPGYGGSGSLDETSFFDTGVIDVERLRELESGR